MPTGKETEEVLKKIRTAMKKETVGVEQLDAQLKIADLMVKIEIRDALQDIVFYLDNID